MKTASSLLLISLFSLCSLPLYARTPLYSFTPNPAFPPTTTISYRGIALVEYQLTNNSQKTHTLKLQPVDGITQMTAGSGVCNNPFVLAGGASCTLSLKIDAAIFNQTSGQLQPVVCQQGADGNPSPYQCYRPAARDLLQITIDQNQPQLTISPASLALSVTGLTLIPSTPASGQARTFTITNQGPGQADAVTVSVPSPGLPSGASVSPTSCGTLSKNATCTVTISPGTTPSDAPNDTSAEPLILQVLESGVVATFAEFDILSWGSVYQEGYVFSITETADSNSSITGKVAALSDTPYSLPWERNDNENAFSTITETSSTGKTDGVTNTNTIVDFYGNSLQYAAGWCQQYTADTYTNWYLPAMCELSYSTDFSENNCGSVSSPLINNLRTNLYALGYGHLGTTYWASTAVSGQQFQAWSATFGFVGLGAANRTSRLPIRCAHTF